MLSYVSSQHLQEPLGVFCKIEYANFNGEQEKESIICVKIGKRHISLGNIVCYHLASHVMLTVIRGAIYSITPTHT